MSWAMTAPVEAARAHQIPKSFLHLVSLKLNYTQNPPGFVSIHLYLSVALILD